MVNRSVTLCTIAETTLSGLLEWVAYHRLLGFSEIVVYAIGSIGGSNDMLARFAARGIVTYRTWPDAAGGAAQPTVIADAVARCRTTWMLYLQTDEYMTLRHDHAIETFLGRFPEDVSAVAINWRMFIPGAVGSDDAAPLIGRFRKAAPRSSTGNRTCRMLVRTADISRLDTQTCRLQRGRCVDTLGQDVETDETGRTGQVEHSFAQINRYGTRDQAPMSQPLPGDPAGQAMAGAEPDRHVAMAEAGHLPGEEDRSIIHWLPVVREQIALLSSVQAHSAA